MKRILPFSILTLVVFTLLIRCKSDPIPPSDEASVDSGVINDASDVVWNLTDIGKEVPEAGSFDFQTPGIGPILYNGGDILTKPINIYVIWYGKWDSGTIAILTDLLSSFGTSSYNKTNTDYYQACGAPQIGDTEFVRCPPQGGNSPIDFKNRRALAVVADASSSLPPCETYATANIKVVQNDLINYTHGASLYCGDVETIITEEIGSNHLPLDPDGVYFVFTSKDVYADTNYYDVFCGNMCGWHNNMFVNGLNIRYSFVGDTERCPSDCSAKDKYIEYGFDHSPNYDWSADGMSSVIIHELSEMMTDPDSTAWYSSDGSETMDHCAWVYGKLFITGNGSVANTTIGDRDYLLQESWSMTQSCINP
jgi:hypothetical protein